MVHRFGDFELDLARRELRRAGVAVHLEPQAFDLLGVLVAKADRVVSNAELLDGVWGHRFLSEANITTRVKEVRAALGDDGRTQHTIRNVRGRGYRFVAPLSTPRGSGLVGREGMVRAVLAGVADAPLVTLTGPGGVGKSSLARAVAAAASDGRFADGVHLVELAPLTDGRQVLPTLARVLDVVLDPERPERAMRPIGQLDALVVLDNCEHVVDDAAALIDRLVGSAGPLRVVATSQVRLGLSGEQVIALEPLGADDALTLFVDRVRAVQPGWAIDTVGRERVLDLLDRLDRLPLTIEIAAARLSSMSFDELAASLDGTMPLTRMTHRSPSPRHRSLEAMARWSAGLLDDGALGALVELSVFAGAFDASDAAAVVASGEVAPALAELTDRSLLVADHRGPRSRYQLLSTVRAVASGWAESTGVAEPARHRHARHVALIAADIDRRLRTPGEAAARMRLDAALPEVRAAHRWARANDVALASELNGSLHLAAYWTFWNEPADWSRALLEAESAGLPARLAGARLAAAGAAANRGDLAEVRSLVGSLADDADVDPRWRAAAAELLSDAAIYAGDLAESQRLCAVLRQIAAALDDRHAVTLAAVNDALALVYGGRAGEAVDPGVVLDLSTLAPSDRAWVAFTRGEIHAELADGEAVAAFDEAIVLARAARNPFVVSVAQLSLATEHGRHGRYDDALAVYATCLRDYVRHGNYVHAVTSLRNLVSVLVATGDDEAAAVLGAAATRGDLRRSYGAESAQLADVLDRVARRVGAGRFDGWSAVGRGFELDGAVRWAADRLTARTVDPQTILRRSPSGPVARVVPSDP